jgi:succinate-acetate transporter protein
MRLDRTRLRRPELIVGVGGLVLLGSMLLLPWYTLTEVSGPPGPQYFIHVSVDGWNGLNHARWLLLVTIVVAFALVFFQLSRRAPAIPVTFSWLTTVFGGLATLWLIYRVLISPAGGREAGGFIGLLSAGAITYGGYASVRLEGIAPADAPSEIPTIGLGEQPAGSRLGRRGGS